MSEVISYDDLQDKLAQGEMLGSLVPAEGLIITYPTSQLIVKPNGTDQTFSVVAYEGPQTRRLLIDAGGVQAIGQARLICRAVGAGEKASTTSWQNHAETSAAAISEETLGKVLNGVAGMFINTPSYVAQEAERRSGKTDNKIG